MPPTTDLAERFVTAGLELLAENGPADLTARRVADRAGSSTMGLYSRFGGRAGLLDVLYRRCFEQLATALAAGSPAADPVAELSRLTDAYRTFALADPHRYTLMFNRPLADFTPGEELRGEVFQQAFAPLIAAVRRAGAQGAAATRAAYCLWCVMHGLVGLELTDVLRTPLTGWGVTGRDEQAAERMYRAGVQAMITGLELG
jgi:AcrR family transcriptional regulator